MKPLRSPLHRRVSLFLACAAFSPVFSVGAAEWPPALDASNTTTKANDGRTIERYTHGPRAEWGYPESASGEWGATT